jgi:PAS domain S-box-containing protein
LAAAKAKSILGPGKGFGRLDPETAREPLGVPPIGNAVISGQTRAVPDLNKQPVSPLDPDWMREEGISGYAINPISYNGEALGAIVSATREPFQDELRPWGPLVANHIGAAIANARAFEEIRVTGQRVEQANQRLERELVERKETEEKLRQSEQRYRRLVDTASEGICEFDEQFRITLVNRRTAQMLGYEPQEVVGWGVREFLFEGDWAGTSARRAARRRGLTERYEQRLRRKDGSAVWMQVSAAPVLDAEHRFVGSFVMLTDITERKRAEDELHKLNQSLRESERKYRELVENANSIILRWGRDGRVIFLNEFGQRFFGYTEAEIRGRHVVGTIVPETGSDGRSLHLLMDEVCANPVAFEQNINENVRRNGERVWVAWTNKMVLDAQGQVAEILSIGSDITARKRAEEELRRHQEHLEDLVKQRTEQLAEAKDRAEAANREKSTFLANMSHELRTPLNAVLGFSRQLRRGPDVTPRQQEALDIIVRSGEHLLNLINNVLDMAKIESGRVVLEESEVDLHQLLHEIQSLMGVGATEKGLHFALEHAPDLPRFVAVDAGKLRQVLLNLVGNAIKYTDSGGVKLRARLIRSAECGMRSAECGERAQLRFEVEDSGPGISQEDCKRIFFPFVQLGGQSPAEAGTGLGLAICKQYVELMGGRIGVAGEPGKGSVFYFSIPVSVLPSVAEPEEPNHGRLVGLAEGQPCCRLLIVEDQAENRLLLRRLLEPLGFELREAANGREAVALFKQWRPDLIWMDIRMPVMDGLEAVRRIRATKAGADTKIIALTAQALEEERGPIMAAGCDDLVRKPFREQELFDALARHLRLKFIYEKAPRQESAPGVTLRPEQLDGLPAELLQDLRQAVVELDTARTQALIQQVTERDASLGRALNTLATQLGYKRLLKLLKKGPTL